MGWEERFAAQASKWSPPAQEKADITVERDEVYTCVGKKPSPSSELEGSTIHFIERETRYWIEAHGGEKNQQLFARGVKTVWEWIKDSQSIKWFTDGERHYGKELWNLASVYLKSGEYHTKTV